MLKSILTTLFFLVTSAQPLWAAELYCASHRQRDVSQRGIVVNCADAADVADKLITAWQKLRNGNVGPVFEEMCLRPYKQAKQIHPIVDPRDWSPAFLSRCNAALRYVR